MRSPIDLTRAETAPFAASEAHALLASFAGRWSGSTRLWLDPTAPPEETALELLAESILGGRWLRLSYHGLAMGKPHAGEMLLGFHKDAGEHELAWVDSFHTGSAIMLSRGGSARADAVDVLGSYGAGEQRWGWRTRLHLAADALVIEAFNISPEGQEYPAIASRLTRQAST